MNIRERIHKRFRQLGRSQLRATDADAERLALIISESHSLLGAFTIFCTAPTARTNVINDAIVLRWLDAAPQLLDLPEILSGTAIEPAAVASLGDERLLQIYDVANSMALHIHGMRSDHASEFANCISKAASSSFSFYQKCLAPEDHTLKVLFSSLVAYLQLAVPYAAAANMLLHTSRSDG